MSWLERLKNQKPPDTYATKPTKPPDGEAKTGFVGFVASIPGCLEKSGGGFVGFVASPPGILKKSEGATVDPVEHAANDPKPPPTAQAAPEPDRFAWPHSVAMNAGEIDSMVQRIALFDGRGLTHTEAETLADKLVQRDREAGRMGACGECRRLAGHGAGSWKCTDHTPGNELAGARLSRDWLVQLHTCPGHAIQFTEH